MTRLHPGKPALFWGDREFLYSHIWQEALHVRSQLRTLDVKPGDRVALWLKNCPEFVSSFFGILQAGAVVVPINNFLKLDEVNFILADAGVDIVVTDAELGSHHRAMEALRPQLRFLRVEEIGSGSREAELTPGKQPASEAELAVIVYTSGTTGRPKGAMLSHGNLLHNVDSCRIVLQTVEADRFAVLLPLFHSYMLTVGMLLPLLVGGSMVLIRSLHPVRNVLLELVQRNATVLPAIPAFYRSLANVPGTIPFPFRVCISGAAPLPAQVLADFEARFRVPLIEGYGLSEASPVVTKNPLFGKRKPGSIGLPIPNVEVSIQNDSGRLLGNGEAGEVCVRGGNVMMGYWNQPAETARVMRDGWLLTGDIGYRDEDGYYYITDRKKDMILVNGMNVYPREIEDVLYAFQGVKEAAVIGKADARKGEQPVAFVSLIEGSSPDEFALQHFLRKHLADYKVPRKVVFLPDLPRNATGKILKTVLRELAIGKH